jgi:hypothetical protein
MKLSSLAKIYIIEFPSDIDVLNNKNEGTALSSSLDLVSVTNLHYRVYNFKMLQKCLLMISQDIIVNIPKGLAAPYLHFSGHGNKDGLFLTSRELIGWELLRKEINKVNKKIRYIMPKLDVKISALNLCFSVCKGYHGTILQKDQNYSIYSTLVGPNKEVDWADSLVAFVVFYHAIFNKNQTAKDAVLLMNKAAGLENVFEHSLGFGLDYI